MAYTRGEVYIFATERHFHLWAANGADGWEESVWASGYPATDVVDGADRPSGVAIPADVLDDFVVMRFAELYSDGTVSSKIERSMQRYAGNGGCGALVEHGHTLLAAIAMAAVRQDGSAQLSSSAVKITPLAKAVTVSDEAIHVRLADGREVSAPLVWFARLRDASPAARLRWRLIGGGVGIRWDDADEDISVAGLLATH